MTYGRADSLAEPFCHERDATLRGGGRGDRYGDRVHDDNPAAHRPD